MPLERPLSFLIACLFLLALIFSDYLVGRLTAEDAITSGLALLIPLVAVRVFWTLTSTWRSQLARKIISYSVFFSVAILASIGVLGVMNGLVATSKVPYFFGFSFYTASLAFQLREGPIWSGRSLVTANPLLLYTGPIVTMVHEVFHWGLRRRIKNFVPYLIAGIFMSMVIALGLSPLLSIGQNPGLVPFLVFGLVFELYIYFNFAGLSLMVYGVAGILGLRLPLNFQQPFSSSNLIDFWRGWHLSMSTVLKSIFFTPVRKAANSTLAIFVVFLSSALWHGVSVNFVLWGLLHASAFVLTSRLLRKGWHVLAGALLPICLVVARGIFGTRDFSTLRANLFGLEDVSDQIHLIMSVFKESELTSQIALLFALAIVLLEVVCRNNPKFIGRNYKFLRIRPVQVWIMALSVLLISGSIGEVVAAYGQR